MKVTLIFKGAQPTLYKGNMMAVMGQEVEFDKEEADFRLKYHAGLWEKKGEDKKATAKPSTKKDETKASSGKSSTK